MKKLIIIIALLFLPENSYAGVGKQMEKLWKGLGAESSTNATGFYMGQHSGNFSAGSMYWARPKKNRPLITVNMPNFEFDTKCFNSGVASFGGLDFISGPELKQKLTGMVQQTGMMFVYLGISSVSPVLSETLQEVYSKLQELGGLLADECTATKQIMAMTGDSLVQKGAMSQDMYTKLQTKLGLKGGLSKVYKDFPKGSGDALDKIADSTQNEKGVSKYQLVDLNIAWDALKNFSDEKNEVKEMLMTLSGTIIIKKNAKDKDGAPDIRYISSTVTDAAMLNSILKGDGSFRKLSCDKDKNKCLDVKSKDEYISIEDSLIQKVVNEFGEYKASIEEDRDIKKSSQALLAKTGMPLFKTYEVMYRYTNGNPDPQMSLISEIAATKILTNYLSDSLTTVTEAANNLQVAATEELKAFKDSLYKAQQMVNQYELENAANYKTQLAIIERGERIEGYINKSTSNTAKLNS